MNTHPALVRLMTLAFHFNLAAAAAMVLWTAWTGYLVATGQIRPMPTRTAPADAVVPVKTAVPACDCPRPHRDELQVRATPDAGAA